jgi:hypothetical protein
MYPMAYVPYSGDDGPYAMSSMQGYIQDPDDTMWFGWKAGGVSDHHEVAQTGWPKPHANWTTYASSSTRHGLTDTDVAFQNKGFGGNAANVTSDGANSVKGFKILSADLFMDCYRKVPKNLSYRA